jgi:hypothetical protein
MKRLLASLFVFILMLSSCSRQLPVKADLGAAAATWTLVGDKVHPDSYACGPSLGFGLDGSPIVALQDDCVYVNPEVYVRQWINGQWKTLGSYLDVNKGQAASGPSMAVDHLGRPIVAWYEISRGYSDVYVKRWDGQNWVLLGGKLDVNPARGYSALSPSLAIDSQNRPVVAWMENDTPSNELSRNVYVKRWENENAWVSVGGTLDVDVSKSARSPKIAVDPSDRIVVSWTEESENFFHDNIYVRRWNGRAWISLGGVLNVGAFPYAALSDLALDSGGRPYVSWREYNGSGPSNLYVKYWNGNTWISLGSSVNDATAGQNGHGGALTFRNPGGLVVVWTPSISSSLPGVYVNRWNGSAWVAMGTQPVAAFGYGPIATNANNVTMLALKGKVTSEGQSGLYLLKYQ